MESIATASTTLTSKIPSFNRGLRVGTKFLAVLVLLLIYAGALVKSHEAGLSVPDWPTTYGQNMFLFPIAKWEGGIFFEHTHRLLASGIGVLTLLLTFAVFRAEQRAWVKALAALCLFVVVFQGVLGGLTVIYLLPASISIAHGILAQIFFLMTILLAYSQSHELAELQNLQRTPQQRNIYVVSLVALAVVFVQLFLGALMRHLEAGLALLDFPSMGGFWLPIYPHEMLANANRDRTLLEMAPVDMLQMASHLAHRVGALAVLAVVGGLCWLTAKYKIAALRRLNLALGVCLIVQIILGITSVLSMREPISTSFHVLIGALLLGLVFVMSLRTYQWNRKNV